MSIVKQNFVKICVCMLGVIFLIPLISEMVGIKTIDSITYDELISLVKSDEINTIKAQEGSQKISLILKDDTYKTSVVPDMEEFSSYISEEIKDGKQIIFEVKGEDKFSKDFIKIVIMVCTLMMVVTLTQKAQNNDIEIVPYESRWKFEDVAGIDEEKSELQDVVEFLKKPEKYESAGAKIPKGILLYGEPGTGKTLLAKAIAGEAGVPFYQMSGAGFEERLVGVGAARVRKLFKIAKNNAPCIIFIDEIDSLAKSRYEGKNDSEQSLNQLLASMDGFESSDNVIVIAATNRFDILDPALIRPGRFDRHIFVSKPDVLAREKILEIHAKNKKFAKEVSLKAIAKRTVGFVGAELENLLNEAAIFAVNDGRECITLPDVEESIAKVLVGLSKKNSVITEFDKKISAVHESGHAVVAAVLRPNVKNLGITIVPRGKAGGYNMFDSIDSSYQTKSDLYKQIQILYAGRIAEEIICSEITNGAENDFRKATKIANLMTTSYAMNGNMITKCSGENSFNQELQKTKMADIENLCQQAYAATYHIVKSYKLVVEDLANILLEKETLSQEEVDAFMQHNI